MEELITHETAVLAKEKGFDPVVRYFYPEWDDIGEELYDCVNVGIGADTSEDENTLRGFGDVVKVSTKSVLARWLRENHGIHVEPKFDPVQEKYECYVWYLKGDTWRLKNVRIESFETFEQAYEYGLNEALNLID